MLFIVWGGIAIAVAITMATSCTLSYQNICTHGTTDNVADTDQQADPDISATANISALPAKISPMIPRISNGPAGPASRE